MKTAKLIVSALCFAAAWLPLHAELEIPCLKDRPVIDGKGNDAAWEKVVWQSDFTTLGTKTPAKEQTRFKVFHDNGRIYFLIEALESAMGKRVCKTYSQGSTHIWQNDSVEINLMQDPKALQFRKWIIDSAGIFCDIIETDDNTDTEKYLGNTEWMSQAEIKTSAAEDRWTVEAAIPFGSLGLNESHTANWKLNIGRNRYAGKTELSSWSVLPTKSHLHPKAFRSVLLKDFKIRRFLLDLEKITTRFERAKDGSFLLTADMTIHNNTGSFARFKTDYTLINRETGKIQNEVRENLLHANSYKRTSDKIGCAGQGKTEFIIRLLSSNTVPVLLHSRNMTLDLQYEPLKLTVIRPAYRNNIYATMPDKTIEIVLDAEELKGTALTAEFTGKDFEDTRKLTAEKTIKLVYDGAKLKDGTYELKVTGKKDGRTYTAKQKIRKLPYQKGEVWIDKNQVTYVDGKPFLPFGWYGTFGQETKPWLNSVLLLNRYASIEKAEKALRNNFEKYHLRTMIFPFQELDPRGWVPWKVFKDPDTRKKGLTPEQRKMIINFVSKVGKCEGLLGWYMADEPECRDNNPLWYEEARELIAELDPYHPCIMLNCGMDGIRKYYKGADILLPDCYPQYFEDGTTGHNRWCSSDWAALASSLRPAWQMPLYDCWPARARNGKTRGVPNDLHDQRSQFFQAVIHNCKGFNMYAWHYGQRYSSFIIGADVMGETLMMLKKYVLLPTVPDGVAAETKPHSITFKAGVKQTGKEFCLMAVNTATTPLQAAFTLKNRFSGKLYVAGENRSVTVRNGRFSDPFEGRETHLYLTDKKLADAVPNVRKTVDAINAFRAGRKKPGNLIGLGELLMADMLDYGKGKLPPGAARLKASSEHKAYINLTTGTLFYLVDGLTKPRIKEYSWTPLSHDRKPWLEIRLPEKHALKELVLYTDEGNLTDCDAVVNGKTFSVRDNHAEKITIPLNGESSDLVRLNILKRNPNGKLLNEVELY